MLVKTVDCGIYSFFKNTGGKNKDIEIESKKQEKNINNFLLQYFEENI